MTIGDKLPKELAILHQSLGITPALLEQCRAPLQDTPVLLTKSEPDMFGRDQRMTPDTLKSWNRMRVAAASDDIILELVSAYRDMEYQCELIRKKIDKGEIISDILKVNAPPGFSEHHTGRALDLSTIGCDPLTEAFELTPAFSWLCTEAKRFNFRLSYPRGNDLGFIYEPWHWAHSL